MLFKQVGYGKGRKGGLQRVAIELGVAAINDRTNDRSIGAWATNPLFLKNFDQRCFGVASGWLGFMSNRFQLFTTRGVPFLQLRKQDFLPVNGCVRVIRPFYVGAKESWKINPFSAGSKPCIFNLKLDRNICLSSFRHLSRNRSFPDQLVERQLLCFETRFFGRTKGLPCRSNRFVGFLGSFRFGVILSGFRTEVVLAIEGFYTGSCGFNRLIREMNGVCPHVGNKTLLVESLGNAHGLTGRKPQLSVGLLLQG